MKIISKPVKICSFIIFPMCFIANIFFVFIEICSEQNSLSLIIYKSSRRIALTIANAPSTLCAVSSEALTRFFFLPAFCPALPVRKSGRKRGKRARKCACLQLSAARFRAFAEKSVPLQP
ncbi:MAG: hypothetical protein ACI4T7_05140 [Alloprevotella sp.]